MKNTCFISFPARDRAHSGDIQRMLLAADQKRVRHVPLENVLALEKVCQEAGGLQGELQGGLGFIYPGTKWCGPGKDASAQAHLLRMRFNFHKRNS